jgi:hypothetical protein
MQSKHCAWISLTAIMYVALTSAALVRAQGASEAAATLVETVRQATQHFQDVEQAIAAGYTDAGTCVSGPEVGAMGVHFGNSKLLSDSALDPRSPEVLVYEPKNGQLRLVAVEYIVDAAAWHDKNPTTTPSLLGQLFHYNGIPNRYGSPPVYELHVWAWKHNPNGMFTDWHPRVSCEEYTP